MKSKTKRKGFSPLSLDAVNFLAADVRGAVGPYLNVFLVTQQHWSQSEVGFVTTISGLLGIAVQTPIGAAIDETRAKRGVIVLALAVLGVTAVVIFAFPTFWPAAIANSLMAVAGDVFGPGVAALTLGLFARPLLARRMGRNAAFDHAGNVTIAVLAGAVGYAFSQRAVFLLVPRHADGDRGAVHSRQGHRLQPRERPGGGARGGRKLHWGRRQRHSVQVAAVGHFRSVRHAVSFRQCADALHEAAHAHNVEFSIYRVAKGEDIAPAIDSAQASGATALNLVNSPLFYAHRHLIMERAAAARLPTIYEWPETAEEGGFAAYGPRRSQLFSEIMAQQIVQVLRGTKVADIPVEQPTKFELVINLKTAKAMGVTVPEALLVRADKVIE
jgi:hypothetical protein